MDVSLQDIAKDFDALPVVRGVNVVFRSGRVTALLGPSGSGKTTILNIIAGLIGPSAGRVLFGDEDVTSVPAELRRIGYVFQSHALFPHLTVAGNVEFPLRVRGVRRAVRKARALEALRMVELEGLAGRMVPTLSGGQRQRVALARALAAQPDVLLLDEPLSALDPALRGRIREELRLLLEPLSIPVVLVTHDQDDAFLLADHVVLLQAGQIAQEGTPEDVYLRPASEAVARFVGVANYLNDADGRNRLFRPEDVELVGLHDAADLVMRIERVHFLGDRRRLLGSDETGARIVVDVDKWHEASPGTTQRLRLRDPIQSVEQRGVLHERVGI